MTFREASLKIDLRINKLASFDSQNIKAFQKEEALNKALLGWIRTNKHGNNIYKEGNESSLMRVDDLQFLLKEKEMQSYKREIFNEIKTLPTDYLYLLNVSVYTSKENCTNVLISSDLREEANIDKLLLDYNEQPSFDFEQTFHTLQGNKIKIFHNNDFTISKTIVSYYRKPKKINRSKPDELWEFKDDLAEIIVDAAVSILAGDIESPNVYQTSSTSVEKQN